MKPVTEDQVQKLLSGVEAREKEALRLLNEKVDDEREATGRMTARVFGFGSRSRSKSSVVGTDVVEMGSHRMARLRRATSTGYFLYSAVARGVSHGN